MGNKLEIELKMDNYDDLYKLLADKLYYSLRIDYVSKVLKISTSYLREFGTKTTDLAKNFNQKHNDSINIFFYNNVEYIGLETRRMDYETDKIKGVNWVEHAIKHGVYD